MSVLPPEWSAVVAHHQSERSRRVTVLIPAILTAFAPVTAALAMLVGWGKSVPTRVDGRLTPVWDEDAFNEKGKLLLAVAAGLFVVAGLVLLLRVLEKRRLRSRVPDLVEWISSTPHQVKRVVLESYAMGEIAGQYAVGYSVPVVVAENVAGKTSELEVSWAQVPLVRSLLARMVPDRLVVDLRG